jgi:hypothetical protein
MEYRLISIIGPALEAVTKIINEKAWPKIVGRIMKVEVEVKVEGRKSKEKPIALPCSLKIRNLNVEIRNKFEIRNSKPGGKSQIRNAYHSRVQGGRD